MICLLALKKRCREFIDYLKPKLAELQNIIVDNKIFVQRTAKVGTLPLDLAINYGCTGPVLRGSGLKYDLRRVDGYSVYPEIDFDVPFGEGKMGEVGDCWDRNYVRVQECHESVKIIDQCLDQLLKAHKRTKEFDPQAVVPKKIFPKDTDLYFRAENPKGELGFYFITQPKRDIPFRCKVRSCCFSNLSILPELAKDTMVADLIAIVGSLDFVLGEVDR